MDEVVLHAKAASDDITQQPYLVTTKFWMTSTVSADIVDAASEPQDYHLKLTPVLALRCYFQRN